MVNLNPEYRLRRIFDIIVPSIINNFDDETFQLKMLEKQRGFAHKVNEQCNSQIGDINQYFDDYRQLVLEQHE